MAANPMIGAVVLYWTHKPVAGGGVEMVAIPAVVTAVDEAGKSVDLTAFAPMSDPCLFRSVAETTNGPRYGCWSRREGP